MTPFFLGTIDEGVAPFVLNVRSKSARQFFLVMNCRCSRWIVYIFAVVSLTGTIPSEAKRGRACFQETTRKYITSVRLFAKPPRHRKKLEHRMFRCTHYLFRCQVHNLRWHWNLLGCNVERLSLQKALHWWNWSLFHRLSMKLDLISSYVFGITQMCVPSPLIWVFIMYRSIYTRCNFNSFSGSCIRPFIPVRAELRICLCGYDSLRQNHSTFCQLSSSTHAALARLTAGEGRPMLCSPIPRDWWVMHWGQQETAFDVERMIYRQFIDPVIQ